MTSDYNLTVATIWPNESGQRGWRGVINRAKWSERDEIYDVEWRQNHIVAVGDESTGRQQEQAQRRGTNRESEHRRSRFRAPFSDAAAAAVVAESLDAESLNIALILKRVQL